MKTKNHQERLKRARIQLLLDHPFWGTLATKMESVVTDQVETTSTNGKIVKWNPEFLDSLSDAQVRGVLAHDIAHAALGHCWRRGERESGNWNHACDKAINGILDAAGLELPDGEVMPAKHEVGISAEALYAALPPREPQGQSGGDKGQGGNGTQDQKQEGSSPSSPGKSGGKGGAQPPQQPETSPGCGEVEDAPPEDAQETEQEWKVAVAQAAEAAKTAGDLSGNLQRLVNEVVNPKVPWETLLRDFIERTARNDYNWSRPNRRYLNRGIILPSLLSEELPEIVLAIDTSASVSERELEQYAGELSAILAQYPTTIHVIYVDTKVNSHQVFTRDDLPLKLDAKGGGGTRFAPTFKWVSEHDLTPACLIYLTDGDNYDKEAMNAMNEPEYPTLWVLTQDAETPFGDSVRLEL